MVEVCDRLLAAAEPVGRALPGVAFVRAVRCLDGALDLTHQLSLARSGAGTQMRWWSLNRFVFGYFADRKLTVDGREVSVQQAQVSSRLQADLGRCSVMTVAFDGHLPADAAALARRQRSRALRNDRDRRDGRPPRRPQAAGRLPGRHTGQSATPPWNTSSPWPANAGSSS